MQQQLNPMQMQILAHFKGKIEEQQKILQENNINIQTSQKEVPNLIQKIHESELTKGKLNIIEDKAVIYKRIGPGLIKMAKKDVDSEVKGRLELLTKAFKGIESNMKNYQAKAKTAQENMVRLDSEFKYAIQQTQIKAQEEAQKQAQKQQEQMQQQKLHQKKDESKQKK